MFSFSKVCIFLLMLFIRTLITTLCFYDFCNNSVGKKMHTLPRCGLIFPFQMPCFLHWLFSSTLLTQLIMKPPEASEQAAKKVKGAALQLLPGRLHALDPANPSSEINNLPTNFFLLCVLPQKRNEFTPAF